jgi:hypothetical protein
MQSDPLWIMILASEKEMKLVQVLVIALSMSRMCLGQSVRQIAQTAFKSVVLLEMSDSQGQPLSLGSGFFIADEIIATNAHVIEGASSGTAKLVGSEQKFSIQGTVALDRHTDLALLKVGSSAPALNLGPDAKPSVGDNVFVVGNPLGLEGTFSEGIVSGIRSIESDSILQMTAPISPGSSGGPVMNDSGIVIGVAEATFKNGQNLNLAVPVAYLSRMWAAVSKHLVVTPLAQQRNTGTDQSIVDGIGIRLEAGVRISDFELSYNAFTLKGIYRMRINNKLPISISRIRIRIIYRDNSNAIMDFEDLIYDQVIPPGLTKTVERQDSEEAGRAYKYYDYRRADGSLLQGQELLTGFDSNGNSVKKMLPRIELRVVQFYTSESE